MVSFLQVMVCVKSGQFSSTRIHVTIFARGAGAERLFVFLSKITVSVSVFTRRTISDSVSKSELKEALALIEKVHIMIIVTSKTDKIFFTKSPT